MHVKAAEYIDQLEQTQGPMPGFREFFEHTDLCCQQLGSGSGKIASRQIVALAWSFYKLMIHMK